MISRPEVAPVSNTDCVTANDSCSGATLRCLAGGQLRCEFHDAFHRHFCGPCGDPENQPRCLGGYVVISSFTPADVAIDDRGLEVWQIECEADPGARMVEGG